MRIYLQYTELLLADFRVLLGDIESVYNNLPLEGDRPVVWRYARPALKVNQVFTGNSVEIFLSGAPALVSQFGDLLSALQNHLGALGATVIGSATAWKLFWEGEKNRHEVKKLRRENKTPQQLKAEAEVKLAKRFDRMSRSKRIRKTEFDIDHRRFVVTDHIEIIELNSEGIDKGR